MLSYQLSFMQLAMLVMNFHDGVSEASGDRILRQWKFILVTLHADGSSEKYILEALYLLLQYYCILSPQAAEQLIWNMSCKSSPGPGKNIPLDMALEQYNNILKTGIRNMGPHNTNPKSVDRFCRALVVNKTIIENFDKMSKLSRRVGSHREKKAVNDIERIVNQLLENNALTKCKTRRYQFYNNMPCSIFDGFNFNTLFSWIENHKNNIINSTKAR